MKRIATALITASSLAFLASPASAETFKFDFVFQADQPAEAQYAELQLAARRACNVDARIAGGARAKSEYQKTCSSDLIDRTIVQLGVEDLLALHEIATSTPRAQLYARLS